MVIWPAAGGLLVAVGATFWPRVRRHLRVASGAAKERV